MARGTFQHEELRAVPKGYRVRTTQSGEHELRIAYPPGRRKTGAGVLVSVLHPRGENPCRNPSSVFSYAVSLGYPYLRGEGKVADDGRTWLSRVTKNADGSGNALYIGYDTVKRKWIVEREGNPSDADTREIFRKSREEMGERYAAEIAELRAELRSEHTPEIKRKLRSLLAKRGGKRYIHNPAEKVGEHRGVEMFYEGISYNAPSLKLWGYSNDYQLQKAIDRKLKAREKKAAASNPYFQETRKLGSRQVVIWANEENGPFHLDKYLNDGETPAGHLSARPLKSLLRARARADQWLQAMARSTGANPTKLEKQRAARERAARIRAARLNPTKAERAAAYRQALQLAKKGDLAGAQPYIDKMQPPITSAEFGNLIRSAPSPFKNPDELTAAEDLYEKFHGRKPREILELQEDAERRGDYAALGDLVELVMISPAGDEVMIKFKKHDDVKLASSSDGAQLMFLGGNQDLSDSLKMFGGDTSKDLIDLGDAKRIVYVASKWQTDFTPQEWKHDFGEESGIMPRGFYDQVNPKKPRIFFAGGNYKVERPGIVD